MVQSYALKQKKQNQQCLFSIAKTVLLVLRTAKKYKKVLFMFSLYLVFSGSAT